MIRNRMAAVAWVFMSIWLGMMGLFTYLFIRDGGMDQFGYEIEAAILAVFWIGGIGGFAHVARVPVIRIDREGESVIVTERRVLRQNVSTLAVGELAGPRVIEDTDDEGAPYFRVEMTMPGDRRLTVAEGHDKATVSRQAEDVKRALGRSEGNGAGGYPWDAA